MRVGEQRAAADGAGRQAGVAPARPEEKKQTTTFFMTNEASMSLKTNHRHVKRTQNELKNGAHFERKMCSARQKPALNGQG
jgi:hypothetical protein